VITVYQYGIRRTTNYQKMKSYFIALLSLVITTGFSQDAKPFEQTPYFTAVIVKNADSSADWYQSVFELKLKKNIDDTQHGFRVRILESPHFVVELIENKSWLDPHTILKGQPEGTQIEGFFKIGFKVSDLDACIANLRNLKISVDRIYTESDKKRNFLITDPDGNLIQFFE
jgi:catechol 2,3-dioxygenase-like lactoylglutathione lyase family enzyme